MPHATTTTANMNSEWQQSHTSNRNSVRMFDTLKSKLSRKSSNLSARSVRSANSNNSGETGSRRSSWRRSQNLQVDTEVPRRTGTNSLSPAAAETMASALRPEGDMRNPSPATRRPDRPGMNAFTVPSNEPPPAYTPSPTAASGPIINEPFTANMGNLSLTPPQNTRAQSPSPSILSTLSTPEDPFAFLTQFDTVFLIDDSGSMAGRSWREVSLALRTITPICTAHDADGIDIYFLNHKSSAPADARAGAPAGGYRNITREEEVTRIFRTVRPSGGTPTGTRCQHILRPYLRHYEENPEGTKPLNIIVLTDGVPSDDVESVLIQAAKKLDKLEAPPSQIGVQFFQVGNEPGAKEALRELDDGLGEICGDGDIRDIVDTVTWTGGSSSGPNGETLEVRLTGEAVLKAVLGAVVRRLDRQRTSIDSRRRAN